MCLDRTSDTMELPNNGKDEEQEIRIWVYVYSTVSKK